MDSFKMRQIPNYRSGDFSSFLSTYLSGVHVWLPACDFIVVNWMSFLTGLRGFTD